MAASGSIELCDRSISTLSREANALRRALAASARQGEGFSREMEKIEDQLHFVQKRIGRAPTDLDLNEAAILAAKVSDELGSLVPSAYGAAVASEARHINSQFRELKLLFGKMRAMSDGMKKKARRTKVQPGKIALLSFTNHAKLCRAKLARLAKLQKNKESRQYGRLFAATAAAGALSTQAEELLLKMAKSRLKGKIGGTKAEIINFMRRAGRGRVFLDHKHLTLRAGHDRLTLPFSPEVKYCLEEMAPVSHWLSNVGKNAVLVGSFEKHNGGAMLRIGERAVVGDSIVYRECSVLLA